MTASIPVTTSSKTSETVSMIPGLVLGTIIAIIAFCLSFDALRLLYLACGVNPYLSWGGPICIDGTILLTTWAAWGFRKGDVKNRWYPWTGFVMFSLFSIIGNALHAYLNGGGLLPHWVPVAVMSIPPIALMYATHLIVIIAGDRYDKKRMLAAVQVTPENEVPVVAHDAMPAPVESSMVSSAPIAAPVVEACVKVEQVPVQPVSSSPVEPSVSSESESAVIEPVESVSVAQPVSDEGSRVQSSPRVGRKRATLVESGQGLLFDDLGV